MPDESKHSVYAGDAIVNVETKHEESDVNVRALLWFVAIFVVFAAVVHVGLWLLFKFYVQLERGATNAPMTQIAAFPCPSSTTETGACFGGFLSVTRFRSSAQNAHIGNGNSRRHADHEQRQRLIRLLLQPSVPLCP